MNKKRFIGLGIFFLSFVIIFLLLTTYSLALTPKQHMERIEKYGWKTDFYFPRKQEFVIPTHSESRHTYQLADVNFHGLKKGTLEQYIYRLKGNCGNNHLEAVLLTYEENIIDSFIRLSESDPGIVKMMDQPVFMEQICQQK
ncbi:hypothetical protein [Fictibacillus phosphorivorans]|uniref:hypothetical protein n=1 Tax=Fictibacillus phosphorivorans TaxID=1221500 RepID=UPI0012939A00|nr:hypothetical protein [Fictibacillus phosphorivorans]MQR96989.1 hypothetical protein [Fictibacillus phosphorivorans]